MLDIYSRRGIRKKFKKNQQLNKKIDVKDSKLFWKEYGYNIDTNWHKAYGSFYGKTDKNYIPGNIFWNKIEPILNNYMFSFAYSDKNQIYDFLRIPNLPPVILKNKNGLYFLQEDYEIKENQVRSYIMDLEEEVVIKPSIDSGGGQGVLVGNLSNGIFRTEEKKYSFEQILTIYNKNFIIFRLSI